MPSDPSGALPERYPRPPPALRPLLALRAWLLVVTSLVIYGAVVIFNATARRGLAAVDRGYHGFATAVLLAFRARIQAVELESLPESWPRRMVMVANHESNLDGPLVVLCLPGRHIRFVVKQELMRVPILGRAMAASGCIPVHRQVRGAGIRALQRELDPDVDVLFFAEGTRSTTGELRPFRKGAFHFAREHGLDILPMGLAGTGACLPPGASTPRPGPLALVVGRPIPPHGSVELLRSQVEDEVARLRERARVRAAEGLGVPRAAD